MTPYPDERSPVFMGRPKAFTAMAGLALSLLAACESQSTPVRNAAISEVKLGDICSATMTFDVTGPYFAKCQEYLRAHAKPQLIAVATTSKQAEHRACSAIGLEEGSAEYQSCVQEMYQLDLGAEHL